MSSISLLGYFLHTFLSFLGQMTDFCLGHKLFVKTYIQLSIRVLLWLSDAILFK